MADGYPICDSCAKSELDFADGAAPLLLCSRCKDARYCNRACQTRVWKEHKKTCVPFFEHNERKASAFARKRIVLITLEDYSWLDDMYDSFYAPIRARCDLLDVHRVNDAIADIASDPSAVILFEPSLMRKSAQAKYQALNNTLVAYVKAGGTVLFGCQCSNQVTRPDLEWYFSTVWGLPWQMGSYSRQDFTLNNASGIIQENTMPSTYNVNAVQLKGVEVKAALYGPQVFGPRIPAAVVWQEYSQGHVAWLGDVNNEEATRNIMMMMCGLWHRLGA